MKKIIDIISVLRSILEFQEQYSSEKMFPLIPIIPYPQKFSYKVGTPKNGKS